MTPQEWRYLVKWVYGNTEDYREVETLKAIVSRGELTARKIAKKEASS